MGGPQVREPRHILHKFPAMILRRELKLYDIELDRLRQQP
jgi:hypothetical protein